MPTAHLLVDASFTDTVRYYQTFPSEPIINPDVYVEVKLPIDRADQIDPISLLGLLDRMLALPAEEKHLLIVTHGNADGFAIPLVPGGSITRQASGENLHLLKVLGAALDQIPLIRKHRPADQLDLWAELLRSLKWFDRKQIFPDIPPKKLLKNLNPRLSEEDRQEKAADTYAEMFEFVLDQLSGGQSSSPSGLANLVTGWHVDSLGVTRKQLDDLIAKGKRVRGKFDRIDFRGCNTGKNTTVMGAILTFFGVKKLTAPDVLGFDEPFPVVVNARFDTNLDANIDTLARAAVRAGRRPVKRDPATDGGVPLDPDEVPKTRRFDTDVTRAGDEVFIRHWMYSIRPHLGAGWMRVISDAAAEEFVRDYIHPDLSRWSNRRSLPIHALSLVEDTNLPAMPSTDGTIRVDTNAPFAPPPPPQGDGGGFALPREPEYRQHLILVASTLMGYASDPPREISFVTGKPEPYPLEGKRVKLRKQ